MAQRRRRELIAKDILAGINLRDVAIKHETNMAFVKEVEAEIKKGHFTYLR